MHLCTSSSPATEAGAERWSPLPAVGARLFNMNKKQSERKQFTRHSSLIFLLFLKKLKNLEFYRVKYHLLWSRYQQAPFSHGRSLFLLLNHGKHNTTKLKEIQSPLQKTQLGLQLHGHPNKQDCVQCQYSHFPLENLRHRQARCLAQQGRAREERTAQVSCPGCPSHWGMLPGRFTELQEC